MALTKAMNTPTIAAHAAPPGIASPVRIWNTPQIRKNQPQLAVLRG
jgi:hypothetical protein